MKSYSGISLSLIMLILLGVIIIAAGIFTIPSIIASFRNIMHDSSQGREPSSEQAVQEELDSGSGSTVIYKPLCRYNEDNGTFHIELLELDDAERKQVSSSAADRIDRALLALTLGPDPEEFSMGYFSALPAGTAYIGSELIRNALYVAFSESIIEDHPLGQFGVKLAGMQTVQALAGFPSIQQIIILADDETVFGPISVSEGSTRIIPPADLNSEDTAQ